MQKRDSALQIDGDNMHYLNHELLYDASNVVVDIADQLNQGALLKLCEAKEIKVVIFDNLSCLAVNVDENDGVSWSSQMLQFVLNLRRHGITSIFIQHAGRNGEMRGHSPGKIHSTGLSSYRRL